ncbi:MAG TPA: hypothetical protein PKO05_00430 [Thermoanaerobaculia bacterium]|jgi:hypothetical protein|nr:MAG: hypothetical protein BWX64_02369 [Acidobacteria bacterium ADurb.Bin051]HNU81881.1 hypothetical protein [Thermoanaerobaculia bacterium]HQP93998.1 hypothetical protein [Thermoanaerobaculia bacterium]
MRGLEAWQGLAGVALVAVGAGLRWGLWAALLAAGVLVFGDYLSGRRDGR